MTRKAADSEARIEPARIDLPVAMPLRVARLDRSAPVPFHMEPDAQERAQLALLVGASQLRKLRFAGTLDPLPAGGWELQATLGVTVVQPCGVSLQPVTTRIDETVRRRFLPDYAPSEDSEAELPEDVDTEPLGRVIDPGEVMFEALVLAVPAFPRAADARLGEAVFTEHGRQPLRAEDSRPMAALASLRDRLRKP